MLLFCNEVDHQSPDYYIQIKENRLIAESGFQFSRLMIYFE
jgi:hypothetical protein